MSRSERLLDLLHLLRCHRHPISGHVLAVELGISIRTLYRDIATLQAQGANIEGEAGVGYVLKPGFLLPPLTFTPEEIEALALGARWVAHRGDIDLGQAARSALARIAAVLPPERGDEVEGAALFVGPGAARAKPCVDPVLLRRAIRSERKLHLSYADAADNRSERTVWPLALAFFDQVEVLVAWCELREDFRHFRIDRIAGAEVLDARVPRRRPVLLAEWRLAEGISKR